MAILKNIKHFLKKILRFFFLGMEVPYVYRKAAQNPVNDKKVIFIEVRFPEITDSFRLIYDRLKTDGTYEIREHFFENYKVSVFEYRRRVLAAVRDIATAKVVFLNDASTAVSALPLREETKIIQVWHACGAFKKFGLSTAELQFGESRKDQLKYPNYKNQSLVTVSSPDVVWAYEEAMNIPKGNGVVQPLGISRTDIFFQKEFLDEARERLYRICPQARNKKILLYAPTFRGRVATAQSPDKLDIKAFYDNFHRDYVLLLKHHPFVRKRPAIPTECSDFAFDVTDSISIEDLLCTADICISDYSSLIFEYSLFEKPIITFAYDLEDYVDWRGFYFDFREYVPGLLAKTNDEMIDYIKNIDVRFDKEALIRFREKFMKACDGNATDRILEAVFDDKVQKDK